MPTLLVAGAASAMIALGFWQIDRLHQKERMLREYHSALADPRIWSLGGMVRPPPYSKVRLNCSRVVGRSAKSGRNAQGEAGWAQLARCGLAGQGWADVVLGWSRSPAGPEWNGGEVRGIALARTTHFEVIADPPLAGLAANRQPDPADIPNNHLSYAIQWFLFALTAVVIYAAALSKRVLPVRVANEAAQRNA